MLPQHSIRLFTRIVATAAVCLVGLSSTAIADEPEEILFHDDYNTALREAKLTGKPLFLEFRCSP